MKDDERINTTKRAAESLGYHLLHYGLLAVFIYCALFLGEWGRELLIILTIWLGVLLVVEAMKAVQGVPPFSDRPKEHCRIAIISSFVAAVVAVVFAWIAGLTGFWQVAGRFVLIFLLVFASFNLWFFLYKYWEKRSL